MQIIGRRSSVFTRLPLLFAEELGVAVEVVPIADMMQLGPEAYAGNPALKLPILRRGDEVLFGAQNICRAVAESSRGHKRVLWPEALTDTLSRNAQELVWHLMTAQVQLVMGTVVNQLPADNGYFMKARAGMQGSLGWLDENLVRCLAVLPRADLSLFEVSLFCLVEHLVFRPTMPLEPYPALREFVAGWGTRDSARATAYRFD
jgi:glutathione S-transferase